MMMPPPHKCASANPAWAGYVNAQYRFLVKPTGDYTAFFADADIFLNWSDILTVLIPTSSALSSASFASSANPSNPAIDTHEGGACPICLSPPTAPRMTKCGHVFCFPCILHYLSISDAPSGSTTPTASYHGHFVPGAAGHRGGMSSTPPSSLSVPNTPPKWKRCPVCWDAVYAHDLKAVQWWDARSIAQVHDTHEDRDTQSERHSSNGQQMLSMRLIERPHLTTLALPQSSTWPLPSSSSSSLDVSHVQPIIAQHSAPWHFQPDVMAFCKFMLATPDLLFENLSHNLDELEAERSLLTSFGGGGSYDDGAGLRFVEVAEAKVREQMGKVETELNIPSVRSAVGLAKNDLKEHEEVERGKRERDNEALSRRERKRREREREREREKVNQQRAGEGEGGKERDGEVDVAGEGADAGAAADYIAFRVMSQGGAMTPRPNPGGDTSPNKDQDDAQLDDGARREPKSYGRNRRNVNPPAPSNSSFLYFQAASGQNIYLHPLDIKVLLSVFESYSAFPRSLRLKIQGADEGSMNDELKRRCKYLGHLPKGTDVVFVEVDWESMTSVEGEAEALIKKATLKPYEQALKQRKNKRRDRERREDRAKSRAEEAAGASDAAAARMSKGAISTRGTATNGTASLHGLLHHQHHQGSPDLLGSSLGSSTGGNGAQNSLSGRDTSSSTSDSPSFREAALFGAEREFPIHPVGEEDFPAVPGGATLDDDRGDRESQQPRPAPAVPSRKVKTTVWGTPAPSSSGSFANVLHSSSRVGQAPEEEGPDWDAWLELEEDFIVGARSGGNSVKDSRGLNRQVRKGAGGGPQGAKANTGVGSSGGVVSIEARDGPTLGFGEEDKKPHSPPQEPGTGTAVVGAGAGAGKKQAKKKKLVLTSGGGGRGAR